MMSREVFGQPEGVIRQSASARGQEVGKDYNGAVHGRWDEMKRKAREMAKLHPPTAGRDSRPMVKGSSSFVRRLSGSNPAAQAPTTCPGMPQITHYAPPTTPCVSSRLPCSAVP